MTYQSDLNRIGLLHYLLNYGATPLTRDEVEAVAEMRREMDALCLRIRVDVRTGWGKVDAATNVKKSFIKLSPQNQSSG